MSQRIGWAMLVAGVVFFGGILCSHQKTEAFQQYTPVTELDKQPAPQGEGQQGSEAPPGADNAEVIAQLKQINAQLKDMKTLLLSGRVTVGVVQNPENVIPESKEKQSEDF